MPLLLACWVLTRPLVLAHYMPWYESKPFGGQWGWHWTMNHFDPERQLASRYRPLIGAYDSADPAALECQTLQMKVAGIDGVFIDWYGTQDLNDYSSINRNAGKMIQACAKAGLKFSVVIEDQVVPGLVKAGKCTPEQFAESALQWLHQKWFNQPGYLRRHGKPVLLMFGPQYYKEPELSRLFGSGLSFFSLLGPKGPATGAFGWPEPQVGDSKSWEHLQSFDERGKSWQAFIPVAYPRFEDIYKQAGVGPGYGEILDADGSTFQRSLSMAERSGAPFIQIATWNDWGEGTQIEPSVEFGYWDLELLQKERRRSDPSFPYLPADLRLPAEIYRLRKLGVHSARLDLAARQLMAGHGARAAKLLAAMSGH